MGQEMKLRQQMYMEFHGDALGLYSQRILCRDGYKFVYNGPDIDEFYDLHRDPHEMTNLVDHPSYQLLKGDLIEDLIKQMQYYRDPLQRWIGTML